MLHDLIGTFEEDRQIRSTPHKKGLIRRNRIEWSVWRMLMVKVSLRRGLGHVTNVYSRCSELMHSLFIIIDGVILLEHTMNVQDLSDPLIRRSSRDISSQNTIQAQ